MVVGYLLSFAADLPATAPSVRPPLALQLKFARNQRLPSPLLSLGCPSCSCLPPQFVISLGAAAVVGVWSARQYGGISTRLMLYLVFSSFVVPSIRKRFPPHLVNVSVVAVRDALPSVFFCNILHRYCSPLPSRFGATKVCRACWPGSFCFSSCPKHANTSAMSNCTSGATLPS